MTRREHQRIRNLESRQAGVNLAHLLLTYDRGDKLTNADLHDLIRGLEYIIAFLRGDNMRRLSYSYSQALDELYALDENRTKK